MTLFRLGGERRQDKGEQPFQDYDLVNTRSHADTHDLGRYHYCALTNSCYCAPIMRATMHHPCIVAYETPADCIIAAVYSLPDGDECGQFH